MTSEAPASASGLTRTGELSNAESFAERVAGLVAERLSPPAALRRGEAARFLSVSDETFDRYVRPHLRVVRLGGVRVYPRADLDAFLEERASSPLEDVA